MNSATRHGAVIMQIVEHARIKPFVCVIDSRGSEWDMRLAINQTVSTCRDIEIATDAMST